MAENILVVDDEPEIADLIEVYLKNENLEVLKCYHAKEALSYIGETEIDLAILDIMMPDTNGLTICQRIRENDTFPVIMLTAKDQETDKITGLMLGADDYITKPFRPLELVARVKAQLRRYKKYNVTNAGGREENVLTCAGLVLNSRTHECMLDENVLSLTPTEFAILRLLLERKGEVVSSEQL